MLASHRNPLKFMNLYIQNLIFYVFFMHTHTQNSVYLLNEFEIHGNENKNVSLLPLLSSEYEPYAPLAITHKNMNKGLIKSTDLLNIRMF